MAERRKEIRLWAAGKYHRLGDAADWEEVVAYLKAADNVSGPLASRLSRVNQPIIRTRNTSSTLLPSLLANI